MFACLAEKYVDFIDVSAVDASEVEDTANELRDLTTEWPIFRRHL